MARKKLGVIVNPIAGMGGKVGLKGTDGPEILARARALGAKPLSPTRATLALKRVAAAPEEFEILTGPGAMGADEAKAAGLAATVVGETTASSTSASDTKTAARAMARAGVDLLMFAGGDGTARDIFDVVGHRLPILGIPTGVKIHSAVFATSPASAGNLAAAYLGGEGGGILLRDAEVMDIDEEAVRENRVSARLYGYAKVPYQRSMLQGPKSAPASEDAVVADLCGYVASQLEPDTLYIVGPGTTTKRVLAMLGLKGALLGIDAVKNGTLIATDLNEAAILKLIEGERAKILVTVIGGQGYIFGRGNQQISHEVIRRIGRDNIVVIATMAKLLAIECRALLVDTGDPAADELLAGYIKVVIGPDQSTVLKVAN